MPIISIDLNKNLKLHEREKIVFHSQNMGNFPIWKWFFPSIWLGVVPLLYILGLIITYEAKNFIFFCSILFVLITHLIFGILLYDLILSESDADLYITSQRVVFVHSMGLLKFKRKNKEIDLLDISYIQIWSELFEIVKKREDGEDKYTGSEKKFRYWIFKRNYSISFNLTDASNSEITQKILQAIKENISFVKHPNLEGILLFKNLIS